MKFQPSAIAATNMSGKSGGTVATITNVFRRKSNPRQPRTEYQTANRSTFTSLSTGWGGLTKEQQDSFIAAAPNFVFYKNGEAYTLKGNTLYQKLNNNILRAGGSVITTAPMPAAFPNLTMDALEAVYSVDQWFIDFSFNEIPPTEGYSYMAIATPGLTSGKHSIKNKLRELGKKELDFVSINITEDWINRYGNPIEGQYITMGFYLINTATGQASKPQTKRTRITVL